MKDIVRSIEPLYNSIWKEVAKNMAGTAFVPNRSDQGTPGCSSGTEGKPVILL